MDKITLKEIRALKPCYDPSLHMKEDWEGTLVDFLHIEVIPNYDRIWVAVRLAPRTLVEIFAIDCAFAAYGYDTSDTAASCSYSASAYTADAASASAYAASASASAPTPAPTPSATMGGRRRRRHAKSMKGGNPKKGMSSKTRKGKRDFVTHKSDKYYNRKGKRQSKSKSGRKGRPYSRKY